jgi:hypothetical protein
MSSSTKFLQKYIKEIVVQKSTNHKKLWVFDFDDTLVKTDATTHVTCSDGTKFDLTPGEFAVYEKQSGQTFDYTDFQQLINPRAIKWMNRILHNVYAHHGAKNVVILSARSTAEPIVQFLQDIGLRDVEVVALDNANPLVKATWIDARIKRDGYDIVEFFDDSPKNVAAVRELERDNQNVQIIARHIVHNRINSLNA